MIWERKANLFPLCLILVPFSPFKAGKILLWKFIPDRYFVQNQNLDFCLLICRKFFNLALMLLLSLSNTVPFISSLSQFFQ